MKRLSLEESLINNYHLENNIKQSFFLSPFSHFMSQASIKLFYDFVIYLINVLTDPNRHSSLPASR